MRFLCLIHGDSAVWDALPEGEAEAMIDEHLAYDETLRLSAHFIIAQALQPPDTATIVRVRNGTMIATDGPFIETKEQLGGFILIEAKDMDEAIQIAAKIPSARLGAVEVRPIRTLR